jgi:ArsR family transcriptional regulator
VAAWIEKCQYRWVSNTQDDHPSTTCCSPVTGAPLSPDQAEDLAHLLRAIADPVRLRLISLIASHPDGQVCVCDLTAAFDLTGPTISHHLKVLRTAGLIEGERRGTWVYYWLVPDVLNRISAALAATVPVSA